MADTSLDLTLTAVDIVAAADANGDGVLTDAEKAQARTLGFQIHQARVSTNGQAYVAANQFARNEYRALIKLVGPTPTTPANPATATKV